jgi:pyruvate,water dikinase
LHGGIFYLQPRELDELVAQHDLNSRIAERRRNRAIELSLEVPAVLFSDTLEVLGRPLPVPMGAEQMQGIPLSAGVAEGRALVLTEPTPPPAESGYILVCPSTDPAWVPLFVHAKGLVMESGGTLSHGAIVAREFGLPAVAGILGVQHHLHTGQHIRVDGTTGRVTLLDT